MHWKPLSLLFGSIAMMAMIGCDAAMMENGSVTAPVEEQSELNDESLERNETVPGTVPDVVPESEPVPETEEELIPDGRTPPNTIDNPNDGAPRAEDTN